ncbi:MAG: RluA family pseudouridine synthase [Bacteroidota bacterium]
MKFPDQPEDEEPSEELFEHHRLVVPPGQELTRIDKYLFARLPNVTRSKVQTAIKDGYVQVNQQSVKPNYKVRPDDKIVISLPEPPRDTEVYPEDIPLDIIYEDDYLLIVNKPAGMVVHPAHRNWSGTLVNALVHHFQQLPHMQGNEGRPGLVHRIDKDTSGLLVIAKTEETMTGLAKQFFHHTIERTYQALVWGEFAEPQGTIDVHIGRSLKDRRVTVAFPKGDMGRHAITHYQVLKPLRYVSLVQCRLETGRTHQIRAHMNYIGHPLFNDSLYGGSEIRKGTRFTKYKQFVENCFKLLPRQALHAKSLGFEHPITKEQLFFNSDLPEDFQLALDKWEHYVQYN